MLNPDYRDKLSIFSEEKVEYLLVGAYALAAHGNPRATGDIAWVQPIAENVLRVIKALTLFGVPIDRLKEDDFLKPDVVFKIGIAPRRIDILTSISGGYEFEDAWRERMEVELEGMSVPVISRRHLIENKRAAGMVQGLLRMR